MYQSEKQRREKEECDVLEDVCYGGEKGAGKTRHLERVLTADAREQVE